MYEIVFLTMEQVIAIHDEQREKYGGVEGIKYTSLVDSAVNAPRWKLKYEGGDIADLAAVYMWHIANNHGFEDANKRTGTVAALDFLAINGYHVEATEDELVEVAIQVGQEELSVEDLADWFRSHTMEIEEEA